MADADARREVGGTEIRGIDQQSTVAEIKNARWERALGKTIHGYCTTNLRRNEQ